MVRAELLHGVARDLAMMLQSDSGIPVLLSFQPLLDALVADDKLPNMYERECLVFGGDTGEGDPKVEARFPNTTAAIGCFF